MESLPNSSDISVSLPATLVQSTTTPVAPTPPLDIDYDSSSSSETMNLSLPSSVTNLAPPSAKKILHCKVPPGFAKQPSRCMLSLRCQHSSCFACIPNSLTPRICFATHTVCKFALQHTMSTKICFATHYVQSRPCWRHTLHVYYYI